MIFGARMRPKSGWRVLEKARRASCTAGRRVLHLGISENLGACRGGWTLRRLSENWWCAHTRRLAHVPQRMFSHKRAAQKALRADLVVLRNLGRAEGLINPSSDKEGRCGGRHDDVPQHSAGIAPTYESKDTACEKRCARFFNKLR